MLEVKGYVINGIEYMVMDGYKYAPEIEGIKLFANRREGIGADRVLVVFEDSFLTYDKDGIIKESNNNDYLVLNSYLREMERSIKNFDFVKHLGESALTVRQLSSYSVYVTECFLNKMKTVDCSSVVA